MKTPFRLLVLLAVAGAFPGCTIFARTGDIYRPLHSRIKPDFAVVIPALSTVSPGVSDDAIRKSLGALWYPRFNFSAILGYGNFADYLYFEDINRSLELDPENPFAWALLSNYASLERQPAAAQEAADHALAILSDISRKSNNYLGADLDSLRSATEINRAIFLNLQGKYAQALGAVDSIGPEVKGDPLLRLATVWAKVIALEQSGKPREALKVLDFVEPKYVRSNAPLDSKRFDAYDYPQYFDVKKRQAVFDFLRGEALLRLGSIPDAEGVLAQSIKLYPHLSVNSLSLGTALYADGHLSEASRVLQKLVDEEPSKSLYSYDLALFNLADVQLALGHYDQAIAGFHAVINNALARDVRFRTKISDYLPLIIRAKWISATQQKVFGEASNNLALTILAESQKSGRPIAWGAIESLFQAANEAGGGVAQVNFALAEWNAGRKKRAIQVLVQQTRVSCSDPQLPQTLLNVGASANDAELSYQAFSAYASCVESGQTRETKQGLLGLESSATLVLQGSERSEFEARLQKIMATM
jgi:hypothetical protein